MQPSLPSCPECGERLVMFDSRPNLGIPVGNPLSSDVGLYACVCLACGYATLRVDPDELRVLRKLAEKGHGTPPLHFKFKR